MEEILALIPDTDDYYVGWFVYGLSLRAGTQPYYSMRIRAIRNEKGRGLQFGDAQIYLTSGEFVPVKISRSRHLNFGAAPRDPASLADNVIGVDVSMLTPEQAKEAKLFVQRFEADNRPV